MTERRPAGRWVTIRHLAAWLLRRRRSFVVEGESMAPTLHHGDLVLTRRFLAEAPGIGDIVVARDPDAPSRYLIKRVRSRGEHTVALGSDDPTVGRDSRQFGSVSLDALIGRAVLHLPASGPPVAL